jgi:hypothetical protein
MTKKRTFNFGGFVIVNEAGEFFNSRNGKFYDELFHYHIYWDFDKAEKVASGYNLRVAGVGIDVKVELSEGG